MFDIIKLGQLDNQENAKLTAVHKKELKAPVSAMAPLDGFVCCSVGPKVCINDICMFVCCVCEYVCMRVCV